MELNTVSTTALLGVTPAAFNALLRDLPEAFAQVREGIDGWTVSQVLAHLIHGERTDWLPRIRIILRAGESETFPAFQRNAHLGDPRSLSELLVEFANLRAKSLSQLKEYDLSPKDLERRGRHPTFGTVTLSQLLATWSTHDLTHLHQISRILASPYRQAVGPWNRYLGVLHCEGHSEEA